MTYLAYTVFSTYRPQMPAYLISCKTKEVIDSTFISSLQYVLSYNN